MAFEETIGEDYRSDWPTPPAVTIPLHAFAYAVGGVALDPCSNPQSIVGARHNLMLERGEDGLTAEWVQYTVTGGIVFMNPPYGREIKHWIAKAVAEAHRGTEIVGLVPGRVDTKWFGQLFNTCDAIGFWRGRIKFLGAPDMAKFPSVVPYWGRRVDAFEETFGPLCHIVRL
jgi:hypothetical protein